MNHIDKSNPAHKAAGISAAQATLDARWDDTVGQYTPPLDYDHCDHDAIRNVLLAEQYDTNVGGPVCCYCMRRLYYHDAEKPDNVTIEHIIPNKITQAKWDEEGSQYQTIPELREDKVKVCVGGTYNDGSVKINGLPHPHFMSYHNMIASCDGGLMLADSLVSQQCCNERRGNNLVLPMYFSSNIQNEIEYSGEDGDIELNNDNFKKNWFYQRRLNLLSPELKKMRRFWYLVSTTEYTASDIEKAVTDQDLRDEIQTVFDKINRTEWQSLGNVTYLEWLSSYCWFYYYFKN